MKNLIIFSILFVCVATACSSAPEGFCECLQKGEELNVKTQEVLRGRASEETKSKMIKLRDEQKKACAKFQTSSGDQMREWQEACAD